MALSDKQKKYLIAGLIGVVTIAGAAAYLEYKKLMNYIIKFKGVKVKKITLTLIDFDLFLNFENKSNVPFIITSQKYDVYINNMFVTKLENNAPNTIAKNSTSVIGLNVKLNPKQVFDKLNKGALDLATNADKLMLKVDMKLNVKLWLFNVSIPYIYEDSIANIMKS